MTDEVKVSPCVLTRDQRPRVFISSTLNELKAERAAVKEALISLKLQPVMFEEGATPHPPRDVYKGYVEQSHIYVGIFWKSYGWIAPSMDISGLEDEYNLSSNKPRLLYIKESSDGRDPRLEALLKRVEAEGMVCYKKFSSAKKLVDLVQNDVMQVLSETFLLAASRTKSGAPPVPNYLDELKFEMGARGMIERKAIAALVDRISRNPRLVVVGEPGVGKTYALGSAGAKVSAIYVSLGGKSAQHVFSYLANCLSLRRHGVAENLPSEADARAALQEELANTTATLLIDDADRNPIVLEALLDLDVYGCRLVVASRNWATSLRQGLPTFPLEGFTRDEIDRFFEVHNVSLSASQLADLVVSSRGNPLYLYYFVTRQISPPPEGLAEYEAAIWRSLAPIQQEAMNLIAFSYVPLNAPRLHELLDGVKTDGRLLTETTEIVNSLGPLLRLEDGRFEIFHSHFQEYIRSIGESDGSSAFYHKRLGELAVTKGWAAAAAYHFLACGDKRVEQYLVSGASEAMLQGNWPLAHQLLDREVATIKANGAGKRAEAYARYLRSQVYVEIGRRADARTECQESIRLFRDAGDAEWVDNVELWSATLLLEEGRAEDSIAILDKAAQLYEGRDPTREAVARLNLSFACLTVSRFGDGAKAAERALELFRDLRDEQGVRTSLVNLSACVGALGNLELQEKYARQLIAEASGRQLWRLKCAGLNHLARVQRRKKDPLGAQKNLEECIAIAKQMGSIEVEALNLASLGNAFRDQKRYVMAESAYVESLTLARQHHLSRQEGHALELIGKLKCETGYFAEGIKLGNDALAIHLARGEHLRIASTYEDLGDAHEKLGQIQEAAECLEGSGSHYVEAGLWDDAGYRYAEASIHWCAVGENQRALLCASRSVDSMMRAKDPKAGRRVVARLAGSEPRGKKGEYFLKLLEAVAQSSTFPLVHLVESLAVCCKRSGDTAEKAQLKHGIELLIKIAKSHPEPHVLNALALALEQADAALCGQEDLGVIEELLCENIEHLYSCRLPDKTTVWTVGLGWNNSVISQILVPDPELIVRRMGAALALIILGNQDALIHAVSENGGNLEKGFTLGIVSQKAAQEEVGLKLPARETAEDFPADLTTSNIPWEEPQPPTFLILRDDYESLADLVVRPGNKAFLYVIMCALGALVGHCTHHDLDDPRVRKETVRVSEGILAFSVRNEEPPESTKGREIGGGFPV